MVVNFVSDSEKEQDQHIFCVQWSDPLIWEEMWVDTTTGYHVCPSYHQRVHVYSLWSSMHAATLQSLSMFEPSRISSKSTTLVHVYSLYVLTCNIMRYTCIVGVYHTRTYKASLNKGHAWLCGELYHSGWVVYTHYSEIHTLKAFPRE